MTHVSAVALARAIGIERLSTGTHLLRQARWRCLTRHTPTETAEGSFDASTPDSFVKERLQSVVQPFLLIQFTPGHLAQPQCFANVVANLFPGYCSWWVA